MINGVNANLTSIQNYYSKEKQNTKETEQAKEEAGVTLEISSSATDTTTSTTSSSATYKKPETKGLSAKEISTLKEEAEKSTETLRSIVEKLINGQIKNVNFSEDQQALTIDIESEDGTITTTEIDDDVVSEAQAAISEDGEWGVKAVSKRIVDFAKAISGGDSSKLEELKDAIEEGFKAAAEAFGGELPDISKDTYTEIMKQFDEWENGEE